MVHEKLLLQINKHINISKVKCMISQKPIKNCGKLDSKIARGTLLFLCRITILKQRKINIMLLWPKESLCFSEQTDKNIF